MLHLSGQGLRCITYDQRGHGRSSQPGYGYEYDTLSDDLASLLEHLDVREVTLVGHLMGCGEIVRHLSRHGSSRVARAVFIGTATPFPLKTPDNPGGVDKAVFDKFLASCAKDFQKWPSDNARPFFLPETSQEMVQWAIGMFLQASLKAPDRLASGEHRDRLSRRVASHHRTDADHSRRCRRLRALRTTGAQNRTTDTG
jgi:non-heme chloroperoxidase